MNEWIVAKLARRYEQFAAQELAMAVSNRDLEQLIADLLFESRNLWAQCLGKHLTAYEVASTLTARAQNYLLMPGRASRVVPEARFAELTRDVERLIGELSG